MSKKLNKLFESVHKEYSINTQFEIVDKDGNVIKTFDERDAAWDYIEDNREKGFKWRVKKESIHKESGSRDLEKFENDIWSFDSYGIDALSTDDDVSISYIDKKTLDFERDESGDDASGQRFVQKLEKLRNKFVVFHDGKILGDFSSAKDAVEFANKKFKYKV